MASIDGLRAPQKAGWTYLSLCVLALIVGLYVVGELSNAQTHLHPMQKDGNYYDECELTLAVRDGESPAEFIARRHWGPVVVNSAYTLHWLGGAETHGRRLVALGIVVTSLVYLVWLVRRYALLRLEEAILMVVFWVFAGGLSAYTTFGLIPYPLRIPASVLLLHLAIWGFRHGFPGWRIAAPASLFTLIVYLDTSCLVAVAAAAGASWLGDAFRCGIRPRAMLGLCARFCLLLGPAVALTLYLTLSDLHPEILNPHRNLNLYFTSSGFPQNPLGLLTFAWHSTASIARRALEFHPLFLGTEAGQISGIVLGGLSAAGCLVSLMSHRSRLFPVAAFVVLGILGQFLLSVLRLYPYGELRYFLPYFAAFPIFACLALGAILRMVAQRLPQSVRLGGVATVTLVLIAVQAVGVARLLDANHREQESVRSGFKAVVFDDGKGALVLDDWTVFTGRDAYADLLMQPHYVLKTNVRTQWRNVPAGSADDVVAWNAFLAGRNRVGLVTSMPFNERYMGAIYAEAAKEFEVTILGQARRYYFAELNRRSDK